jgi:hypothetical protein
MPMPPILEVIDWKSVFESGVGFDAWLEGGEHSDHVERMRAIHTSQELNGGVLGRLGSIQKDVHVVAIAEDWCGDVIRHAPVLQKMCDQSDHLKVRYVTREGHPEVFVRFLTNGGEAIPKFIFLSDQFVECGNWGPMSQVCRDLISRGKACGDVASARKKIGELYKNDAARSEVVDELMGLFLVAGAEAV